MLHVSYLVHASPGRGSDSIESISPVLETILVDGEDNEFFSVFYFHDNGEMLEDPIFPLNDCRIFPVMSYPVSICSIRNLFVTIAGADPGI